MLPVKKVDIPLPDNSPSAVTGFVKILGSIQGLQQRLGDFSYGEVSIAEAKVKMLVKQLSLLREKLDKLVQRKLELEETTRLINEIPIASFDQVKLDTLKNHPQLHAILQFSGLFSGHVHTAAVASEKLVNELSVLQSVAEESLIEPALELPDCPNTNPPISTETPTSEEAAPDETDNGFPAPRLRSVGKEAARIEEFSAFTIPSETMTASEDPNLSDLTRDWSFDLPEEALTQSGDFEFSEESVREEPEPKRSQTKAALVESIGESLANRSAAMKSNVAPVPAPRPETTLDHSKALVPAQYDFDHRLLEDVIKSYGDFTTANLPAILASSPKPPQASAPDPAPIQFTHTTAERKVMNVQKSGDLDRQLKKIIKDYGEYDIYERKTFINFKTGGLIAFAVLGLVLVILYLFKASAAVSTQRGTSPSSRITQTNDPPQTHTGAVENLNSAPNSANSRPSTLTDNKQNP